MQSSITIQLAVVMKGLYDRNTKAFNEILVTGTVHRQMMVSTYGLLVKDGVLTEVEKLNEKEKSVLWERCKELIA